MLDSRVWSAVILFVGVISMKLRLVVLLVAIGSGSSITGAQQPAAPNLPETPEAAPPEDPD